MKLGQQNIRQIISLWASVFPHVNWGDWTVIYNHSIIPKVPFNWKYITKIKMQNKNKHQQQSKKKKQPTSKPLLLSWNLMVGLHETPAQRYSWPLNPGSDSLLVIELMFHPPQAQIPKGDCWFSNCRNNSGNNDITMIVLIIRPINAIINDNNS